MPAGHHLHALDHYLRAVLGSTPGWTEHLERLVPPSVPGTEHPQVRESAEMIDVQMRDEHLADLVQRDPSALVVGDRAFSEIEHEFVAVAELDEDRRVHLAGTDERRSAHEGDSHLVRLYVLGTREPVCRALQPRLGPDTLKHQAFLPAFTWNATGQSGLHVFLRRRLLNGDGLRGQVSGCKRQGGRNDR